MICFVRLSARLYRREAPSWLLAVRPVLPTLEHWLLRSNPSYFGWGVCRVFEPFSFILPVDILVFFPTFKVSSVW